MPPLSDQSSTISDGHAEALAFLRLIYGPPTNVNTHKPATAIHADYAPCEAYPAGSSWRIEPDGAVEDITEVLIEGPQ